ncbi:MAG TPA: hypothetical protein VN944_06810 [Nitrospiria bacterium]|nr:hypothetical protein [Nitrospiria bacterium]
MRVSKAQWSRSFCKVGEVLTLSTFPAVIVFFCLIYFEGFSDLYFWTTSGGKGGESPSLWHSRGILLWKNIISLFFFYLLSLIYFRTHCKFEKEASSRDKIEPGSNVLSALVMMSYVVANTNTAWDFGMTLIPHWESSIFPIYYWVGNLLAGSAFLFLLTGYFIAGSQRVEPARKIRDSMGKLLLGFTLLWVYMFWSQAIRIWYGNLSHLTEPLNKRISGNFGNIFILMFLFVALIPFFGLIFRKIKLSVMGLSVIAFLSCTGIWLNCFLIVMPEFSDGGNLLTMTWNALSLALTGISFVLFSMAVFFKWFPAVNWIPRTFPGPVDK